ncbi:MAG: glycosyltransferase family 2 protein [Bacteroidota bacterium]|nr:glycosyltransferase family 2 protein [Bacteroidota bacterium]
MLLKFLFWFSFIIIFYSYLGYGLLIYLLVRLKRWFFKSKQQQIPANFEPGITLVICAYNEAGFMHRKIQNSLDLEYPAEKLNFIFISDGSDDQTPEIIRQYPRIQLLHQPGRRGKVAAMNRAMPFVHTPYVIFSDANTLLNKACIKEIVSHYVDPAVGGVAGEKRIISREKDRAAGAGEGLYWEYESFLKKLDSEFYTVVGAAGDLFSIKTVLFHQSAEDTILDDFVQSMQICKDGYVMRYEPNAYAIESASTSMKEEQKRKIRISAGAFQAMIKLKDLFNVFKYPVLSFQFISHRVLRWTFCPVSLFLFFLSNALIVYREGARIFTLLLIAQLVFYAMAWTGWIFASRDMRVKAFYIPYYFMFMNLSVFIGFYRFLRKRQTVAWEKSARRHEN